MKATVIDTLRYANRLKEAGVETVQAEAMSRALNDELTERLVTKTDLANAVSELGGRIDELDAKFEVRFAEVFGRFAKVDGRFAEVDGRFAEMEAKFDARFAEVFGRFAKVDGRFGEMGGKFEAVDAKIDALRSQNRYVFLVLALIAGLGLYNATAPHFLGRMGQAPSTQPIHSAPAAQAPVADGNETMGSGADG